MAFKLTPQRMAILKYLEGNEEHPSAESIYQEVKKKFPTMSYATVYNTLEMLKKRGRVLELTIDPDRKRYDPNTEEHHHLICRGCSKIVDIHLKFSFDLTGIETEGFSLTGNHIEFYGICPDCKRKGGARGGGI